MIITGDCLETLRTLEDASVQTCVTSPPYWGLRDYGVEGQLGLEKTPDEYVGKMVEIFRQVRRVLKEDGTLWLNLGDSYASTTGNKTFTPQTAYKTGRAGGNAFAPAKKTLAYEQKDAGLRDFGNLKPKDLVGIPWKVAFALQADGWYLRQDIIWNKPNPMPESVRDRCTKAHEYIFLLSKSPKYYFDHEAIKEPTVEPRGPGNKRQVVAIPGEREGENSNIRGSLHKIGPRTTRNKRSVWTVTPKPFKGAHFATFPMDLIEPCILAGAPVDGIVLDPFAGAGTTGVVCKKLGRQFIGCELNPEYVAIADERIKAWLKSEQKTETETA